MKKASKEVSEFMSRIAKDSHRKNPRTKAFYRRIQKKSVESRMRNKLSTR